MAKLSLKHLYKIYDNGTKAVDDFNLEISDDEFIVFVGPSGCGKSTTLRMIAGLEDITAGDFLIDGKLANNLEPKDRDMAMVFQNYALYPHMTVYDNMAFGLKIRHVPKQEINDRVQEAARILDITDQLTKKPKEMSGGQRQRVALGRAIVRKPQVFLLDEPLSNLDAKLRSSMRSEITNLHNKLKTTFIYVTHDQVEAMTMGTRIVVMKKGVIQQVDTPMNLYDYPSNLFVAGFIGTPQMNFLDAKLFFEKGSVKLDFGSFQVQAEASTFRKLNISSVLKNNDITVGVRPEHILLAGPKDKNCFETKINIIESLGNEANFFLETLDGKTQFTARMFRNDKLNVGDTIKVKFDLNKIHLFEKESTNSLLPRTPSFSTVKVDYKKGQINILGQKIKPIPAIANCFSKDGQYYLDIPNTAFIDGKELGLPIVNKECINKKWLIAMEKDNNFINFYSEKYIDGDRFDYNLDWSKVAIYDEQYKLLHSPVIEENVIDGKLIPVTKPMMFIDNTMSTEEDVEEKLAINSKAKVKTKKVKVFDYQLFDNIYSADDKAIIKIYALLGKKFHLHDIKFSIANDNFRFDEVGLPGTIKEIYDYGMNKYYLIVLDNNHEVVVKANEEHQVGDHIHLTFDPTNIGVYDVNFGVKLI